MLMHNPGSTVNQRMTTVRIEQIILRIEQNMPDELALFAQVLAQVLAQVSSPADTFRMPALGPVDEAEAEAAGSRQPKTAAGFDASGEICVACATPARKLHKQMLTRHLFHADLTRQVASSIRNHA